MTTLCCFQSHTFVLVLITSQCNCINSPTPPYSGTILFMRPANERRCYDVTLSLIGRAHTQNDPCLLLLIVWNCYHVASYCIPLHFISLHWTLYVQNFSGEHKTYIYILCHSSTLIWHRWLKPYLKQDKDLPILHSQCHGCWCPGDARSQDISSHDIDLVKPR